MGELTSLMARDGHEFRAWLAAPAGTPKGAIVVIQEIFGINSHIRAVTDSYAAEGYVAIAPSLFDRVRKGIELGYGPSDMQEGRGYLQQLKPEQTLKDVSAALAIVKHAGRVGMVGFCWGGKVTYQAACELPLACGVVYYGGGITQILDKKPKCAVMYHFGERDQHIPADDVAKIKAAHPEGIFHMYAADHGFNCDQRASYDAASAALARNRTLEFFAQYVAGEKPKAPPQ
ncbi:MAG: dienelactone hydrolase family protein [Gammaproteobacteria bacterium]